MKTFSNEIELIERYFDRRLTAFEYASFSLRLATDAMFRENVGAQSKVRMLVKRHYLQQLKRQAHDLHLKLYNDPGRGAMRLALDELFKP